MIDEILKCWFGGFNERDWDAIQNLYSEDALVHGREGDYRGGESVVMLAKKWLAAFPDTQITPLYSSSEGDVLVVHWRAAGTFVNPIWDIAATGEKLTFHGLTFFRHNPKKIVEHWASVDYRPLYS